MVGLVQNMNLMKALGIDLWLKIYGEFFSLPPEHVNLMSEYFTIWDQLCQCCGMLMSKNFRNELVKLEVRGETLSAH
jgi:hypothetical protein